MSKDAPFLRKSTYLSKLAASPERRRWPRRNCHFMVRLVYTAKGIRRLNAVKATIVDISEGGARINTGFSAIPDHFYIVLGNFEYFMGVSVVNRSKSQLNIEFLKEQKTQLIDTLSSVEFPMSTIQDIKSVPGLKSVTLGR